MKIERKEVFETNSSSTHSLCIKSEDWEKWGTDYCEPPYVPIEKRETLYDWYTRSALVIKTSNYYKRGGGYILVEGALNKMQFIASCMSSDLDTTTCRLRPEQIELFQAIREAMYDYAKNKFDVGYLTIKSEDYYGDGSFVENLIGWYWTEADKRPFTKEQVYQIVTRVITDDDIIFICHSDETGPFPDDLGLEAPNYKDLLPDEEETTT